MERNFIPVDDIIVEDRMRDLDAGWVEALADDIAEKGLLQPIGVRASGGRYVLIFGEHRLAAEKLRGKPDIEAVILPVTAAQAKVMEIDENILRMPFAPLDFARSLAKRKAVYEEAYPLSKHGAKGLIAANTPSDDDQNDKNVVLDKKDIKSPDGKDCHLGEDSNKSPSGKDCHLVEEVQSFSENTAEKLGVSPRKIRAAIWLHKHFDPVAEMHLKGHPIMDNAAQLTALAKLDPRDQETVAQLIADGTYDKVADAEAHITGAVKPSASEKLHTKFIENWARAPMAVRATLLRDLAGSALPKGYIIITPERDDG